MLAVLAAALTAARAEPRDFTNKDGKTIKGDIKSVSPTHAEIRRVPDQRIFKIPLDTLSAPDREYLARWREENPEFKLEFEADKETKKLEDVRKGTFKSKTTEVSYRVTVTNRGEHATPAAQVHFLTLMEVNGHTILLPNINYERHK